jgi:hypothetical protein
VNSAAATTVVNNALTSASLDYTIAQVSIQNSVPLDNSDPTNFQVNGVTVAITYPIQLNIPFTSLNGTPFSMTQTVTMRQEF